ncbi:hypothetical protein [Sunxiuqinia sp. sy24]|uniref:hypothetical protein n=1 Tax=Sunxiuqinia sp. sy24 TaxID=3461495 RepID=UPI0040459BF1
MKAFGIFILLFMVSVFQVDACRFTVREIGFSILSQDIYTIAVIDENANAGKALWKTFHEKNRDCNLRLEVLSPRSDLQHPIVKSVQQKGIKFPCTVLVAPDGRIFQFDEKDISTVYDEVLESALGQKLRRDFPDVFAVVVWIEGENEAENRVIADQVQHECEAIENIMPGMPKIVEKGPLTIAVTKDDFQNESVLLWSLGLETIPVSPVAFVLYGRGRMIGKALDFKEIQEGVLYNHMSMIGADCECGLDKKWMLGNQVPLLWDQGSRQYLAKLVGFDVDNPMILAEMSRILAKETLSDETGSVAFAPETINLDEVFGAEDKSVDQIQEEQIPVENSKKVLLVTIVSILLGVLIVAGFLYYKK